MSPATSMLHLATISPPDNIAPVSCKKTLLTEVALGVSSDLQRSSFEFPARRPRHGLRRPRPRDGAAGGCRDAIQYRFFVVSARN